MSTNRRYPSFLTMVLVASGLLFASAAAISEEPRASYGANDGVDYRQYDDPGVPAWPATCNCVSLSYDDQVAGGQRAVQFAIGTAAAGQDREVTAMSAERSKKIALKVPVKQPEMPQYSVDGMEPNIGRTEMPMPESNPSVNEDILEAQETAFYKSLYSFPVLWGSAVMLADAREPAASAPFEELQLALF